MVQLMVESQMNVDLDQELVASLLLDRLLEIFSRAVMLILCKNLSHI